MTCQATRINDQYHCSCGLQWDIDEDDPHRYSLKKKPVNKEYGLCVLSNLKQMLKEK